MDQVVLFCRPGFETECGRELTEQAAVRGVFGYFRPSGHPGVVFYHISPPETANNLLANIPLGELVFTRDWFVVLADIELPVTDRVGAVVDSLDLCREYVPAASRVEVRLPESNEDGDLGNFARKWVSPLSKALRKSGLLGEDSQQGAEGRLEILLLDFQQAFAGYSLAGNRARYVSGIPRLRQSAQAPSRSALKLEEAWKVFLPADQALDYLGGGKSAVDLGAAPGGWTWQLVRQGMMVTAVDNGPMNSELMSSGHVVHVAADGFSWRPRRAVDWMVCDIVDQPRKTAHLAVSWLSAKLCRYTVFNLKLPMKKRYEEWLVCQSILGEGLEQAGIRCRLSAKHLYHDREEITCFIQRLD